jgi:NADPH-dependent 2,4-dienoyl-CoA reductase/sulfur reductase-like enzyme
MRNDAEILVFEQRGFVSYAPCGIPYYVEGLVNQPEELVTYSPAFFKNERDIDVHVHAYVEDVDVSEKTLTYVEDRIRKTVEWDKLIIATGAEPVKPRIPNIEVDKIFTVKFIEDAMKIREAAIHADNIVIVGGGYIGVEMAEAFRVLGKTVTVIEMLPHILPNLDPEVSEIVARKLAENGVRLRLGEQVHEFIGDDEVERVVTDKTNYDADLIVLAVGVRPNTTLARKLGVQIGKTGAIEVENTMETSLSDVYACGDCVETVHLVTGEKAWIPLAPAANKMGYVAGNNVFGGRLEFPGVFGTAFTKTFDLHIARTGLAEVEAQNNALTTASAFITTRSRAGYYPQGQELNIKVIAEKSSGKLLGAQCVGAEAVTGHINAFATLLAAHADVKELFFSDFGYAPPFAQVWGPLVIAARVIGFSP